jgi:hypothetical protein
LELVNNSEPEVADEWESSKLKSRVVYPAMNSKINKYLVSHTTKGVEIHCNKFDNSVTEYH